MLRYMFHVRDGDDNCVKRIQQLAENFEAAELQARKVLFHEYSDDLNTEIDILALDSECPNDPLGKVCFTGAGLSTQFFPYDPPEDFFFA